MTISDRDNTDNKAKRDIEGHTRQAIITKRMQAQRRRK